ncbi:MAG: ribonuclease H-like domain-containing protein [Bacteroidota bacterium]
MIDQVEIGKVLFIDIETVSGQSSFDLISESLQPLWAKKAQRILRKEDELTEEELEESYTDRAGIYAEFGKIVCISVGVVRRDADKNLKIFLKSFANENEKQLLFEFSQMLFQHYNNTDKNFICGHNIKEFDIPYICRRMVINQLPMPAMLQIAGKKPWEVKYLIDTMELWKFGDYKNYTSLKTLAAILDFPSPKDDIDGSEVGRVYWQEKDLDRIAFYCEKDVLATAQLFLRYKRMPIFTEEQINHIDRQ